MKEFSRPPTRNEQIVGIIAAAALTALFGWLSIFLAHRGILAAATVCGALAAAGLLMFLRITFGAGRGLRPKEMRLVAWLLILFGLGGVVLLLLVDGSRTHRLMVLGGSITALASGVAGVRSRGHDA